jgi:hypothetical protein
MHNRLTIFLITILACMVMVGQANSQPGPYPPCLEIHGNNGCAPSPLEGSEVTLTGIVYVVGGTFNDGTIYFQCSGGAGGMHLYDPSLLGVLSLGDEVSVTGIVGAQTSNIRIESGAAVTILSHGNPETVTPIGTGELDAGTDLIGSLMSVQGVLTDLGAGEWGIDCNIDDGSGPVPLHVYWGTGLTLADFDPLVGNVVKITGATKCYGHQPEILPRSLADLELVTVSAVNDSWSTLKATY